MPSLTRPSVRRCITGWNFGVSALALPKRIRCQLLRKPSKPVLHPPTFRLLICACEGTWFSGLRAREALAVRLAVIFALCAAVRGCCCPGAGRD